MKEPVHPLHAGQVYEGFEILCVLDQSELGPVYLVKDGQGRRFALKVCIALDKESAHPFQREAQILQRIPATPHLVRCEGHGRAAGGTLWTLLEHPPGDTLRRALDTTPAGGFPMEKVLRLGVQLATALETIHAYGIVHGDVKPTNVMLAQGEVIKLLGLGMASVRRVHRRTPRETLLRAGLYTAPERLTHRRENASPLWDLYSAGVMMWELTRGKQPFFKRPGEELTDAEILRKHVANAIPSLAEETGYPAEVCAPIMRACAGNPRDRVPSAAAMKEELQEAERCRRDLCSTRRSTPVQVPVSAARTDAADPGRVRSGEASTLPFSPLPIVTPAPGAPRPDEPPQLPAIAPEHIRMLENGAWGSAESGTRPLEESAARFASRPGDARHGPARVEGAASEAGAAPRSTRPPGVPSWVGVLAVLVAGAVVLGSLGRWSSRGPVAPPASGTAGANTAQSPPLVDPRATSTASAAAGSPAVSSSATPSSSVGAAPAQSAGPRSSSKSSWKPRPKPTPAHEIWE